MAVSPGPVSSQWLTMDEVVQLLRFPSRRALWFFLAKHPAPLYRRGGQERYFMRREDIDSLMRPVAPSARRRRQEPIEPAEPETVTDADFERVEPDAPVERIAGRRIGRPAGSRDRQPRRTRGGDR